MSTKLLTVFQSLSWTFEIKKGTATNEDPVVHIYTNQPETLSLLSIVVPQFQRLCIWWDIYSWCTKWRMTKFRKFQSEELQFCTILVPFRMFWFFLGGFAIIFFSVHGFCNRETRTDHALVSTEGQKIDMGWMGMLDWWFQQQSERCGSSSGFRRILLTIKASMLLFTPKFLDFEPISRRLN